MQGAGPRLPLCRRGERGRGFALDLRALRGRRPALRCGQRSGDGRPGVRTLVTRGADRPHGALGVRLREDRRCQSRRRRLFHNALQHRPRVGCDGVMRGVDRLARRDRTSRRARRGEASPSCQASPFPGARCGLVRCRGRRVPTGGSLGAAPDGARAGPEPVRRSPRCRRTTPSAPTAARNPPPARARTAMRAGAGAPECAPTPGRRVR